jgi:hypothetical protein
MHVRKEKRKEVTSKLETGLKSGRRGAVEGVG